MMSGLPQHGSIVLICLISPSASDHTAGLSRLYMDQDVRSVGHDHSTVYQCMDRTRHRRNGRLFANVADTRVPVNVAEAGPELDSTPAASLDFLMTASLGCDDDVDGKMFACSAKLTLQSARVTDPAFRVVDET